MEMTDGQARTNPADGAQHADGRELRFRVADLPESDGIRQTERGHIHHRVGENEAV